MTLRGKAPNTDHLAGQRRSVIDPHCGILSHVPLLTMTGTINNAGGSSTNNGGTVKIYSLCGGQNVRGSVTTGRLVEQGILMRAP